MSLNTYSGQHNNQGEGGDSGLVGPDPTRANVALTGEGDFFSLRNINGSEVLSQLQFNTPNSYLYQIVLYIRRGVSKVNKR